MFWSYALTDALFAGIAYVLLRLVFGTESLDRYAVSLVLAAIFGALVGASELASRYRDEPVRAIRKPWGVLYLEINALLSAIGLLLIYRYPDSFKGVAADPLLAAIAAGFGAMVIMRTRLAVVKGSGGEDYSIGPDLVLSVILRMVDTNVDRDRALERQRIVTQALAQIRGLGPFEQAYNYLAASLLAFQNLDDDLKRRLPEIVQQYKAEVHLPEDIKYLALGFVFLTIVGEKHFNAVLNRAIQIKSTP